MHACFIPYGKKECLDIFLRDMAAQKLPLRYFKEGEEDKLMYIDCQVRILPFGIWEFVFPKEYMDSVLTTLKFHKNLKNLPYELDKEISIFGFKIKPLEYLKKYLRIVDPPEFKTDKTLLWMGDNVSIIPLGIRYEGEKPVTEVAGDLAGWSHERI